MKRWQLVTLGLLFVLPVLLYVGVAFWALWHSEHGWWIGWTLPTAWALASLMYYRWTRRRAAQPVRTVESPGHWTVADRAAIEIIRRHQQAVINATAQQLIDPHYYLEESRQLALDLARHYHPDEQDPLDSVTITELLAAAELALHDSVEWVRDHVPGSHLLLVRHWRWLGRAPKYARVAGNVGWMVAMLFNPANIGRYLVSRLTWDGASEQLQTSVLRAFAELFVERAGFYLVELHSGRLKLGADRYRAAREQMDAARELNLDQGAGSANATTGTGAGPATRPAGATSVEAIVAVVGQVKAGKSSLVNCLLGERRAQADVLPTTHGAQPYRLTLPDGDSLTLLDTQGYGGERGAASAARQVEQALERADLLLLVIDATSPARQADVEFLTELRARFAQRPYRKPPPIVGVLTHIDALRPPLEWAPPYDWQQPTSVKEQNIKDAVDYNAELLTGHLSALAPACTDVSRGRVFGVDEYVLPALLSQLDEGRAASILRVLHDDWEQQRFQLIFGQLLRAGGVLARYLIRE